MENHIKKFAAVCLVLSLMLIPCGSAMAAYDVVEVEPSAESMIGDTLVARPLGLLSMAVGSVIFVVSLPFSALAGNTDEAADKLVVEPTRFTFKRPLGQF